MKLRNIIAGVDKTNKRLFSDPDWEKLSDLFNIYDLHWSEDTRLKCYHAEVWLCTDSWVGTEVYFLDDKAVCISRQSARKSSVNFEFLSQEHADRLEKYLRDLVKVDIGSTVVIADLEEEWDTYYSIKYGTQIIHDKAIYEGETVDIVSKHGKSEGFDTFHAVVIKLANGKEKEIDCRELKFEYNTL